MEDIPEELKQFNKAMQDAIDLIGIDIKYGRTELNESAIRGAQYIVEKMQQALENYYRNNKL